MGREDTHPSPRVNGAGLEAGGVDPESGGGVRGHVTWGWDRTPDFVEEGLGPDDEAPCLPWEGQSLGEESRVGVRHLLGCPSTVLPLVN